MKRKTLALALAITVYTLAYGLQAAGEWVKHTSAEGRYSVLLPRQPKLSAQEADGPTGGKFTQYMAMTTDADGLFMIGYFNYTSAMTFSLDKARDGMVNAVSGTLLSDEAISLGGHAGREVKVAAKLPDGKETLTRARFYDVNGRVYILQHMFLKSSDSPTTAGKTAKFFDSFKVTLTH